MNWMFEPRSKYYDYDETQGEEYSSPFRWQDILLSLVYAIPFLICFGIIAFLIMLLGSLYVDFDATVKRTMESGELESPGLVYTGIAIMVILPVLIWNNRFDILDSPIITFCSSNFVLLFAVAPLTGLVLRHFKQK